MQFVACLVSLPDPFTVLLGCIHNMSKSKNLKYTDLAVYCLILQMQV